MTILYIWLAVAIAFLIIEILTATFYGLAIALAASIVALYVYIVWDTEFSIIQAIILVIGSAVFAYVLPKFLSSSTPDVPQGFDRYIGEKRTVKKHAWDLKISLDGVDYTVESDDDIAAGDKVEVTGHKGSWMKVKKV